MTILNNKPLFRVHNLKKYFPIKKKHVFQREQYYVKANESMTITIHEGEVFGLVGESGCGKSTFGRTMIQLYDQTGGSTLYYGVSIEDFMPKYVSQVFKRLSKDYPNFLNENKKFDELSELLSKDPENNELFNKVLTAKRNLDNDYSNIFRLVGGLVLHPNLDIVSSTLLERYNIMIELAALKKELSTNKTKTDNKNIQLSINQSQEKLEALEEQVSSLKDEIKDHPKFEKYENRLETGIDLSSLTKEEMRSLRKDIQIIFQDPYSSLNPRFTVGQAIGEGLIAHRIFKNEKDEGYNEYIQDIMEQCGLAPYFIHRYPHQFSGGQRQRICIARALSLNPKFIVCDEAVSALDVSIQSQIINLLQDLKEKNNLTYLFITHDLSVVKYISDRIGVMYQGNLVELGYADQIFENPQHPYTISLLNAIPKIGKDREEYKIRSPKQRKTLQFEEGEDPVDFGMIKVEPGHYVNYTIEFTQETM